MLEVTFVAFFKWIQLEKTPQNRIKNQICRLYTKLNFAPHFDPFSTKTVKDGEYINILHVCRWYFMYKLKEDICRYGDVSRDVRSLPFWWNVKFNTTNFWNNYKNHLTILFYSIHRTAKEFNHNLRLVQKNSH